MRHIKGWTKGLLDRKRPMLEDKQTFFVKGVGSEISQERTLLPVTRLSAFQP